MALVAMHAIGATAADAPVTHVFAGNWQSTDFSDLGNPGCSIGGTGSVPGSRLIMGASLKHPDPMVLIVRKLSWSIVPASNFQMTASFADGTAIPLVGRGAGNSIEFDITGEQVRNWVHELTSTTQMHLAFGGSEPVWSFDLTGTSKVVNAMAECFRNHGVTGLSPPFGAAVAIGNDPQPSMPPLAPLIRPNISSSPEPIPLAPLAPPPPISPPLAAVSTPLPPVVAPPANPPSLPPSSEPVVGFWQGTTNMQTRPFHVDGPWELQWHNGEGYFGLTLHALNGALPSDILVANGTQAGASTAYQPKGGDFYLEIETRQPWAVRAVVLPSVPGNKASPVEEPSLGEPLIPIDGDQTGVPSCDGPGADGEVKRLVEKSPIGQTMHIEVLHVGTPHAVPVRGGIKVCTVKLMTNGGEIDYRYQYYRKEGEIYIFGRVASD